MGIPHSAQVQENFVKIQEAYELLSDQSKRKQYDSSLDFDETLGFARLCKLHVVIFCAIGVP